MKIQSPPGATPLDDETLQGLIPGLTTYRELDEFEAAGIARALLWAFNSRTLKKDLLSASGLCLLHRRMFQDTWEWAGTFRRRETNIGVSPEKIQNELGQLLGDVKYWLTHNTFSTEEIVARFHHRLVWIHPFPNGNGRFSRLAADLLMEHIGQSRPTWGQVNLGQMGQKRAQYIQVLQIADRSENYAPLIEFMKS
ncbi:cell filamentation protein [Bdellovibrio bacteriovorus]|uniref:Cell filamentation protein n=1 Tax=Bdellovibrio bacteriovorus TaxID=959 RepID=A0A162G330_BDEBC|nr:mobile mystery protein B [Bdellovibrio bacteriovorus]KYG64201.1 cell filamentation protein [Bdellovibrio bacteriovorus]